MIKEQRHVNNQIWLVVSNNFYFPSYMRCHPSHWLSYFSRWLKPPTRNDCQNPWSVPLNPYDLGRKTRSAGDLPTKPECSDAQVGSMLGRWKPITIKRPYRSSYTFGEFEVWFRWFRMLWFSFLGSIWIHKWQSLWLKKPSYLIDKKTWFQASTEFRHHASDSLFVGDGDDIL